MADVISSIGNTFLAIGGLCLAAFFVFGIICLLARLWLSFEAFVESKFAEDATYRDSYGDSFPVIPEGVEHLRRYEQ